jgi:hypothetical protein
VTEVGHPRWVRHGSPIDRRRVIAGTLKLVSIALVAGSLALAAVLLGTVQSAGAFGNVLWGNVALATLLIVVARLACAVVAWKAARFVERDARR